MSAPFTTQLLIRWSQLTPEYRASVMKDDDNYDYINPWQSSLINQLITEMVEPVSLTIQYILQLVECKLRIAAVIHLYEVEVPYYEARHSLDKLPYLDKIKEIVNAAMNYENTEFMKGNLVIYHAYSSAWQFVERKSCDLPKEEIERIKSLPNPEEDDNYCFRSVNYSLLSSFRPNQRGENTLWYITSNFSQIFPHDILQEGYYLLPGTWNRALNVDVASLLKYVFNKCSQLGILEMYSIPFEDANNYVYDAIPGGKPLSTPIDDSWDRLNDLQGRLFNYDHLSKVTINPN